MGIEVPPLPMFRLLLDVNASTFTDGKFAKWDDTAKRLVGADAGTVTSVGLAVPAILTVSGSPVTGSGTITIGLANQTANTVLAGPTSGGSAAPSFRALVSGDIPDLDTAKIATGTLPPARGGTGTGTAPSNGQVPIGTTGGVYTPASLTGTSNQVIVSTGAGSITLSLPQSIHSAATPTFAQLTISNAPSAAGDAATKGYVDSVCQGLDTKFSVRAATTANITLSGTQTIDGVAVIAGDRVLVKNQSTGSQNGIYVVAGGAWSRAADADTSAEVTSGLFTFVSEGTVNASSGWVLTTPDPITLGTTSLTFTQFSGAGQIVDGAGLSKSGNTLSVNVDDVSIEINSDALRVKSTWVGQTSLTTLGTITTGTWQGTVIAVAYGGTGVATASANTVFSGPTSGGSAAPAFRALVAGDIPSLDAAKITTGTFNAARLPTHSHSAADITSGTLAIARGGTGVATTPANGQLLIGNGTDYTLAALTAGRQTRIVNTAGAITIHQRGPHRSECRLSGADDTPVTTSDLGSITGIRFVPYIGNRIGLWTVDGWDIYEFTQITLAIPGATYSAGDAVDLFSYWNGSSVALEFGPKWTNGNTRATALAYQDGVLVKSGDSTRRYLGSVEFDSSLQTCSTRQKRLLWNYYNRVAQELFAEENGTSHNYSTNVWREWNNSTSYRLKYFVGVLEDAPTFSLYGGVSGSGDTRLGFGSNSASSPNPSAGLYFVGVTAAASMSRTARRGTEMLLGTNYTTALQYTGSGTGTFDKLQLSGSVMG